MLTSIVILTHNQLALTASCLQSIRRHTQNYELIVVDNGSTDGTVEFVSNQEDITVVTNAENLGFARGCNQGLEAAKGDNILFLNNDTVVTSQWLDNMLLALYANERVGMAGPVTNYSSGHQQIQVSYRGISDLEGFAKEHCRDNKGGYTDVRRLVGFCLLIKRSVLNEIGAFDERFGLGNYEDDDLCLRAWRAGYSLRVVHDSFVHHIGHAKMNQISNAHLSLLLGMNKLQAAAKWGGDIHSFLYRREITVSFCLVTNNAEQTIERTLAAIAGDADEIVIVDTGSTDRTVEIASAYTPNVYSLLLPDDADAYRQALERATKQYVVWLRQDEVCDTGKLRKLSGLRRSIDGSEDRVALTGDMHVCMYRRESGFCRPASRGEEASA